VLTPELIHTVFGVYAHIGTHPLTGRPHITVATTKHSIPATDKRTIDT
jgi:iron complex transport system ATP-binding protein